MRAASTVIALVLATACGGGDQASGLDCFSLDDCGEEQICFLGQCVDPGFSIQEVYGELSPPSNSGYLPQHTPGPLDLRTGYQLIQLVPTTTLSGTVTQDGLPFAQAGVVLVTGAGSIPNRTLVRSAPYLPESGFSLRAVPGEYELRFTPSGISRVETEAPPIRYGTLTITNSGALALPYPDAADLVVVTGKVRYASSVSSIVAGAVVSGEALDEAGSSLLASTAVTNAEGDYMLVFPPGAVTFFVTVRPGQVPQNPDLPEVTAELAPSGDDPNRLEDFVLGIDTAVSVKVRALDSSGQPVVGAAVVISGVVGTNAGTFTTRAETNTAGEATLAVIPGTHSISVAPPKSSSQALVIVPQAISEATTLEYTLPNKTHLFGRVTSHQGAGVARARVTASLKDAPVQREFSVETDGGGNYTLEIDPSVDMQEAKYEITVEPERQSALPRYRGVLSVFDEDVQQDIELFAPTFAYGRVVDADGAPIANLNVIFYALFGQEPLLVGIGQTSSEGEFAVPLPTP